MPYKENKQWWNKPGGQNIHQNGQGTSSAKRSSSSSLMRRAGGASRKWTMVFQRNSETFGNILSSFLMNPVFVSERLWQSCSSETPEHWWHVKISSVKLICITGNYQPWIWLDDAYVPPLLLNAGLPGPQVSLAEQRWAWWHIASSFVESVHITITWIHRLYILPRTC